MADVFCNNCGHKNPLGANFCSSCGTPLEQAPDDPTTITFQIDGGEPRGRATTIQPSTSTTSRPTAGCSSSCGARSPAPASPSPRTSRPPAATRRATSSSTTSPCRAATPSSCAAPTGAFRVRDVGSLNGTYLNRERVEDAPLANGDEVQIGKYKLAFYAGR